MKKWIMYVLLLMATNGNAQTSIAPRFLEVSDNQTTNLVFPSTIVSIDRGSEKIVVQKSMNNVLRVKATTSFNDTTNLTVITSEGILYSFLVHYSKAPAILNINIAGKENASQDTVVVSLAQKVLKQKNTLYGLKSSEGKVQFSLCGVYATGEWVLLKFKLENNSSLSYAIGGARFYSRERTTAKRRSTQEREVSPILSIKQETIVREKQLQLLVVILPKPSLVQSRKLTVDLTEKDGERNFTLGISNRHITNAPFIY